jgi:hypothetical protein
VKLVLALLTPLAIGAGQAAAQSTARSASEAAAPPVRSRLCPDDLPEGVRLPPQPGCTAEPRSRQPRRDGVYDLGNGTTLRIGGRASAEYGARR